MDFIFDAYVTQTLAEGESAVFALGDGSLSWDDGHVCQAHDGAVLCAAIHPSGVGVVTGGDDGRLVWSRRDGAQILAQVPGRWIDALAVSSASGLIAFAAGREAQVIDTANGDFLRTFMHERSVAALSFDPKGRRLAVATYGGAALWYARIAEQKPVMLRWAGSHIGIAFSPDGRFLVSAMQESALHGWRLSDAMDMRMGGYPAKTHSLEFLNRGAWLATSGASGIVLWPFAGNGGPMGKQAAEIGAQEGALVTRIAASPTESRVVAGLDDGRIWTCDLKNEKLIFLRETLGAAISALSLLPGGRVAWGDESGAGGVIDLA